MSNPAICVCIMSTTMLTEYCVFLSQRILRIFVIILFTSANALDEKQYIAIIEHGPNRNA